MISNIRGERARMGWTQEELAERLEVSVSDVRDWEDGLTRPSAQTVLNMSELFDCTTDYLLGRSAERSSTSSDTK